MRRVPATGCSEIRRRAIFDHRLPPERSVLGWYRANTDRLFALVEAELAPVFPGPGDGAAECRRAAAVLWSSLHGLCTLWQTDKMRLVHSTPLKDLAATMVRTYLAGLRAGGAA